MKIALFGSTGKTGIEVMKQSLEKGYEINAFVRDASKLSETDSKLNTFTGDVNDINTFGEVLNGVDAVVVTLGGDVTTGVKNILENMKLHNIGKIVFMSSYPMSGTPEGINYLKSAGMDELKISELSPMINGKKDQEKMIRESGLNWVIVRPTFLKDEPKTGVYRTLESAEFTAKDGISRADVADFILRVLETNEWDRKIASISS